MSFTKQETYDEPGGPKSNPTKQIGGVTFWVDVEDGWLCIENLSMRGWVFSAANADAIMRFITENRHLIT